MLYILMFTLKEEVLLLVGVKKTWKKVRFNYITNEQREIEKEDQQPVGLKKSGVNIKYKICMLAV